MVHEDSRSTLVRSQINLQQATDRIQQVMKFSKDLYEDFESHEKRGVEDWKQSWEEFEDGSAWIGLHWSKSHPRICINFLPCITFWIYLDGKDLPDKRKMRKRSLKELRKRLKNYAGNLVACR